jgi:N6-adenosine-specific RNA methylase IME4
MAGWDTSAFEAVNQDTGEAVSVPWPLPVHEAADVFPLMDDASLRSLADDIARRGLDQPLLVCDGKLVDGRNRLKACEIAGVQPWFEARGGNPWELAWACNGARRDLSEAQKACALRACEEGAARWAGARGEVAEEARAARSAAADARRAEDGTLTSGAIHDGTTGRDWSEVNARRTSTRLGAEIGIGRAAVEKGERIWRFDRALALKVANGTVKATEALRQIKKAEVRQKVAALPDGKYRVIYADPPWSYNDARQTGDHRESTGALHHYSTMSNDELRALDIKSIAADDAVLFCWATFPLLPFGLELVKAWGFAYKTAFVWDKGAGAFGSYHNAAAELLLVCTRGSCTPDNDKKFDQVVSLPRGRHSAKPEEWRTLIDAMYPLGPRIELFRRGDAPEGWEVWGAEAEPEGVAA